MDRMWASGAQDRGPIPLRGTKILYFFYPWNVKGKDDIEKTVLVSDRAVIHKGRKTIKVSDLKIDDCIVVIGSPNENGEIEAKLVRLFNGETKGSPVPARGHRFLLF